MQPAAVRHCSLTAMGLSLKRSTIFAGSKISRSYPGPPTRNRAANRLGIPVALVTNQSGIGRGRYGWDDFIAVQKAIVSLLEAKGARLDAIYAIIPTERGSFCIPITRRGSRIPE